ncbi:PAS domain S-box protein [Aquiflexum sp. TKW24L]|uniref:PAS domain S-box protein n=1 Tax=Aquiflexum sp. TKW24L TaxID=2942212 RepID=UPI0020BD520D|nr:PAS domain S-box protein [Aquiflexum sp. TKW24L]MCL6261568.1 PAS domain S-box protein [Aquiflexum sp. TKW24L]
MEDSLQEFELSIKQLPVAMALMEGGNLLLKVVNQTALHLMGRTEDDVKNKTLSDLFPETSKHNKIFHSVLESGTPYEAKEVELTFQKNGEEYTGHYDLNLVPWHTGEGNIKGVVAMVADVSKNVLERRESLERELLYNTITNTTPDLIFIVDLNYKFTYVNVALLKMWGQTREEALQKRLRDIGYAQKHADMHEREIDEVIATHMPIRGEVSFPYASLGMRDYDYIFVPVIDNMGYVEAVVGITRDITELKTSLNYHKEVEEQFRTFGNNIQNLGWIADGDGNIFWYNQRWLDYTGLTTEEMKGWGWQKVHHPDHVDRILEISKGLWITNEPFELTFPLRKSDGQYRWFLTRGVPITDETGKIYQWIGTNTDIHDRILAEEKLQESQDRYNNLIFSSPSSIGLFQGEDYVVTTANEPAIKVWGRGEEIIGKKYFTEFPELEEQGYKKIFDQVYKTGIPFNGMESPVYLLENGEKILKYYNFILYPQRNSHNLIDGIGLIGSDVTHQALLNNKIKESEKRFANMVAQAPVAICVLRGEDYIIEVANKKQLEMWEKNKQEVINQPLFTCFPNTTGQGFEELLKGVFMTGKAVIANELPVTRIRNGKTEISYGNFVYEPLFDSEGNIEGIISIVSDVTEQVLARKRIEQSEAKYKSLIDSAPIAIGILVGRDLVIESPNEAFIKTLGKGPDIVGKRLTDVMPELKDQEQPYLKILDNVFSNGKLYQSFGDAVKFVRDGVTQETYYNINYVPLFDDTGNVYAILDIASDVTEKIESYKKVQESEKRFRNLADDSPIFVFIVEPDADVSVSFWNKTWLEYTGQSAKDALGRSWDEYIHPEDVPICLEIYANAFKNKQPYEIPAVRTRHHSGEYRWFSYKTIPRYLPDGTFIGYVGVGFDVHEQKLAEAILAESEEKFRSLVQTLPQMVWVSDETGNVEFTSTRWEDYTGMNPLTPALWKEIVHPDDFDESIATWAHSLSTGKMYTHELRLKNSQGEFKWFTVKAEPILDSENKVIKWVGAFTDTHSEKLFTQDLESKVRERTEELEKFNVELNRRNKDLQTFAYITSHDLQEPLRKIQIFGSRIIDREHGNLSPSAKDNFKRMQEAALRMQTLIQDLLTYTKMNAADLKFESTDLNIMIDEIREDLIEDLLEKNATVETNQLCKIMIIPFQFRQLLINLINNSLKFAHPDRPPHIKICSEITDGTKIDNEKLHKHKKYCHISVSDNGIGFEPQYCEKIFEVFQRLHGRTEYKGTGIGLSIVKKVVENHGGLITAKSELNQGATFDIYIPA